VQLELSEHKKVRDLLEYLKLNVRIQDLQDFEQGRFFGESIFAFYIELLAILNQLDHELAPESKEPPRSVLFLNQKEFLSLEDLDHSKIRKEKLLGFFGKDAVIAPLLIEEEGKK